MLTEQQQEPLDAASQQRQEDVLGEVKLHLPPDIPASDEPVATFGDVYLEDKDKAKQDVKDRLNEMRAKRGTVKRDTRADTREKLKALRNSRDPRAKLSALREGVVLEDKQTLDNEEFDLDAIWRPKPFDVYKAEREKEGIRFNPLGSLDKSLVNLSATNKLIKTGYRWLINAVGTDEFKIDVAEYAPGYLRPTQKEGRELAVGLLDEKLSELGNVTVTDYKKVKEAEDLWNKKHELIYMNQLDEAMNKAELPSANDLWNAVSEEPGEFLLGVAQELANKPELIFIPEIAAARGAYAAGVSAKALGATAKTVQVAKVLGGGLGAYTAGVTLGTIDRVSDQSNTTGELDILRAAEQAQVDGLLGIVTVGAGRVITRGTTYASDFAKAKTQANDFAKLAHKNRELGLEEVKKLDKVRESVQETATETYADINGNVYTFEIRDTDLSLSMKEEIEGMKKMEQKYREDPQALEALQTEITSKTKQLREEELTTAEFSTLTREVKALTDRTKELSNPKDLAVNWKLSKDKKPKVSQQFMKFNDKDGIEHTLRRVDSQMLNDMVINAPGIRGMDITGKVDAKKANSKMMHLVKEHAVNVTAPLRNLAETAPTAKLLLDMLDPRAGTKGRNFTYTIPENIHERQGYFMDKSIRLQEMLETNLGKKGHEELRDHMRGSNVSDNPVVLEVAKGFRELLDEVKDYSQAAGLKVDSTPDFLPRYYNRQAFQEPDMQVEFTNRIKTIVDKEGNFKYNPDEVLESTRKITKNIVESDDVKFAKGSQQVQPVGFRKWKDVPDSLIADFLDPEFIGSLNKYMMNAANRAEIDRVFGYRGSRVKDMIKQIELEAKEKGRDISELEFKSINDIYNLMNGSLDQGGSLKALTDSVLAMENVAKLPLVTLTSALEPTTLLFRLNESTGIKGLINAYGGFKARKLFGDMSAKEVEIEARQMGLVHEAAVKERLDAMVGEGLEGFPAKVNNFFMKSFMLHQWTEHTRTVAYEAARNDLVKTIKHLAKDPEGSISTSRRRILIDNNIDPDLAIQWANNGAPVDSVAYKAIKRGAARLTNTAIVNPNKTNKAKWLSSTKSHYRIAGQFKSFGSVFSNDIAKETFDEAARLWNEGRKVKSLQKLGTMFGVVSAMTFWTTYDSPTLFGDGVDEDEAGDVALKMTKGVAGMVIPGAAMLAPIYGGRGLDSALGPAASDASNMMRGRTDPKYYAPSYVKMAEKIQGEEGL